MAMEKLIRVYEEPSNRAACRGCGAKIRWHETLNGKRMPLNDDAVPRKSELSGGRVVIHVAQADTHWATCPEREGFR